MEGPTIIVVPCYNEAARLNADAFRDYAAQSSGISFLFVDDGSTDDTANVLEGLAAENPARFAALLLPENRGKAEAVRAGFLRAFEWQPKHVGFWDADLATPLEDIETFQRHLETRPKLEMVFGARVNLLGRSVRRNLMRHYIGRVFATLAVAVVRVPIYDTQCGAKLFRTSDRLIELFREPFISRWIFDVEIVARLVKQRLGTDLPQPREVIYEHPLNVWNDVAGSKIRTRDFFAVGMDLWRIYFRYMAHGKRT